MSGEDELIESLPHGQRQEIMAMLAQDSTEDIESPTKGGQEAPPPTKQHIETYKRLMEADIELPEGFMEWIQDWL